MRFAPLGVLLMVSGCATGPLPKYNVNPGASTAELSFLTDRSPAYGGAVLYQDGANCKGPIPINIRESQTIRANEMATFLMGGEGDNARGQRVYCRLHVSFTPETGARYLASYELDDAGCNVVLVKVPETVGEVPKAVDVIAREYSTPMFSSGSFCGAEIAK